MKGSGTSTENEPSVDWARLQPSPRGAAGPNRCIFMKTPSLIALFTRRDARETRGEPSRVKALDEDEVGGHTDARLLGVPVGSSVLDGSAYRVEIGRRIVALHHDSPWNDGDATRLALAAAATLGVCVLAGCAPVLPALPMGSFASTGGLLGTWDTTATRCHSGVSTSAGDVITVVRFEHGRHSSFELGTGAVSGRINMVDVQTSSPYRRVELERSQCARFEVQQRRQPDGTLGADIELDCGTGDGGRVTASLHAASCP